MIAEVVDLRYELIIEPTAEDLFGNDQRSAERDSESSDACVDFPLRSRPSKTMNRPRFGIIILKHHKKKKDQLKNTVEVIVLIRIDLIVRQIATIIRRVGRENIKCDGVTFSF